MAEEYTYDHLGRLTKVTNCDGSTISYSYDNAGNRSVMTTTPATKTITVTIPNSAISWTLGSTQNVIWTSSNVTGNVDILLSRDGGLTWETLAANTPNDGSQSVLVSGAPTTQARIRVRATSCSQLKDDSDVNFTIAANGADTMPPDTTMTAALCGQILTTSSATMTWTGSDNVTPPGSLLYQWRLDNGDWTAAAAATSATLPGLANGTHFFEVRATDQAGNTDSSPSGCAFTINAAGSQAPVITLLSPGSGAPATTVTILGANLLNAITLSFGGVSASFTVTSETSMVATVPPGAVTAPVMVTTPSGTATSALTFTVLGTGSGGASCPTSSFTQPTLYPLNLGAEAILVADINRDNLPDIVAANKGSNFITVKLGNGNGSFGGNVNYSVNQPSALAMGDFNLDGNLDLVAANQSSSGIVSVLPGNGAGGFSAAVTFPAPNDTRSIAVADFNADGKLDIVAGSVATDPSVVAVLLNTSSGGTLSFGSATNFTIGYSPSGIATGDFNGDGKVDLATTNSGSSNISVLLGIGNGSFQLSVQYTTPVGPPNAILANDFTGDGKLDLVVDYFGVSSVSVWRGNGDGTFTSIADSPLFAPARGMSAGDFTNDGNLDLALAVPNINTVDILQGNGAGGFTTSASYGVAYSAIATGVGDFDGNGKLDVAATSAIGSLAVLINGCVECRFSLNSTSQTVSASGGTVSVNVTTTNGCGWTATSSAGWITINSSASGSGNGTVQLSVAANPGPLRAGTITIAGQTFVITQQDSACSVTVNPISLPNGALGVVYYQTMSAAGGTAPHSFTLTAGALPPGLSLSGTGVLTGTPTAAGTFNFVITATDANGCLGMRSYTITVNNLAYCSPAGIVFGQPNGSPYSAGREPRSIAVGDFNGDGSQDVAVAGQAITIQVGLGDGRFTQPNAPFDITGVPYSVAAGDFNGDGKRDLAVGGSVNVAIMLGNGNGTFTPAPGSPVSSGNGTGPRYVVVGDFNGDGKHDLAVANGFSINVAILLGDGSGGFSPAAGSPVSAGSQPVSLALGDFNGDGKQDLAVADHSSNNARILLGNGSGGFSLASSPIAGNNPISVAVGDFNGDAKQDLAVALDTSSNNVTIQLGNGDGSFTETGSPINLGTTPTSVAVGDFNGDGKSDLVVAHQSTNATILQGNGNGGFSPVAGSPVAAGSNPSFVAVGDFNGDGKPDFAVGNQNSDNLTIQLNNCAPMINTVAVSRLQGSPASFSIIANVSDAGQAASTLNVSVNGSASATVNGVTVSSLSIDAGGVVTASIFAGCSAATANFTLTVTDGLNSATTTTLTVTVSANPPPTLTYNNQLVAPGGSLTFTPASGPSDNGGVSSIVLQSQGTYAGTINVNNSTGFVSLSNAAPNGVHTITIRATDQCGTITNTVFTLTVNVVIPTLSNYPNATVTTGGNIIVTPAAAPVNAGSITAATSTNFKGTLSVNPTTGVVAVTNAHVAGIYTVTVIAANTSGGTNTRDFTLTVTDPANCAPSSFTFNQAPGSPVSAGTRPSSIAAGEFNGDGNQDLAVANENSNNVTILLGNGNGIFTQAAGSPINVGSVPYSVAVGDFNGDGRQDLVVGNTVSNNVTILLGNGSGGFSQAAGSPVTVGTNPYSIAVSDFNNDGKQDLAVANLNSDYVSILVGNGSGGFSPDGNSPSVGDGPISVALGDFNGDGKQDLATANSNSNNVTILLGNGSGGFTQAAGSPVSVGDTPYSVSVADFNGDGKHDLVVSLALSSNVVILLGNGNAGFTPAAGSPVGVAGNSQFVTVGDFNGDGKQDLAVPGANTHNMTILLGNGGGGFSLATGSPFAVGTTPLSVAVGDFNGDGKQDLASANLNSNNVTILLNGCAPGITAGAPLTREQGSVGFVSTIATVSDAETAAGSLTVAATTVPAGLTVIGIANNSGVITATISASCNATVGVNVVVLTVTDGSGLTSTANLTINVAANGLPILNYPNHSVALNGSLMINPTSGPSDNGNIASILIQNVSPPMTVTPTVAGNGVVTIANANPPGLHTITIRATDNCGTVTDASFTLTVNCPTITLNPATLPGATLGASYNQTITASGGAAPYSFALMTGTLPNGLSLSAAGVLSGIPNTAGTFNFTIQTTDANICMATQSYTVTINSPPSINAVTVARQQGSPATNSIIANVSDPDQEANTLIVTVNGGSNATVNGVTVSGLIVNAAGVATANVVADCVSSSASFTLTVTDSASAANNSTLNVTVTANSAPTLTYNNQSLAAGASLTINPAIGPSENGNVNSIIVQSQGTYTGTISVNNATGVVSLSGVKPGGTHTITIRATDNCGVTADASFTLTVTCPSITISPATLPDGIAGSTYNQTLTASSGAEPYDFTLIAGALPAGLTLSSSGVLNGMPGVTGAFSFTVNVSDDNGCAGMSNYTLTINASASTITVNSLADSVSPGDGQCTLREAINNANAAGQTAGGDCAAGGVSNTINFSVTGTINLGSVLPNLNRDLVINGAGPSMLTVRRDTGGNYRILAINSARTVAISGLTIQDGNSGTGGGIRNDGTLTLNNCVVKSNSSALGGGIYNFLGSLTVINSTISGNNAVSGNDVATQGGGLYSFGGTITLSGSTISNNTNSNPLGTLQGAAMDLQDVTATLINCTISSHSSGNTDTVITNSAVNFSSLLTMTNCTVTANNANFATLNTAALPGLSAAAQLRNTLVAGNSGPNFHVFGNAVITSMGNNLDGDGTSGFINGVGGNIVGTVSMPINPLLDVLSNNGGSTSTHALLPGSPAINTGTNVGAPANDQRGISRPQQTTADIGAVESRGFTLAIAGGSNQSTSVHTAFANLLGVTASSSFGEPVSGGAVSFTSPESGASAALEGNPASLNADGQASVAATANGEAGTYQVAAAANGGNTVNFSLLNCPVIALNPGTLPNGTIGVGYSQMITATGGASSYGFTLLSGALPVGVNLAVGGGLVGTPSMAGVFNFTIRATDANGCAGTQAYSIVINTPPTISAVATSRQQGSAVSNSTIANVSDAEQAAGTLTVTINGGSTATVNGVMVSGLSINAAGLVTANLIAACAATNASFTLTVTDSALASVNATLNITVNSNAAPTLSYNNQSVAAGGSLTINPSAGPGDNGEINSMVVQSQGTYTGTISVNNITGVVSLSSAKPGGIYPITIRATDNCGATADASFILTVSCPTISLGPATLPGGQLNQPYSQTLTANGGTAAYAFTVSVGALPGNVTLSSTGVLAGTPTQSGTYSFTVTAMDANGCIGSQAYSLFISDCPTITVNPSNPTLPNGHAGTAFNQTFTQTSGVGAVTFSLSSGAFPSGLILSNAGVLSGTPGVFGSFNFTIRVTDQNNCIGERAYTLLINPPCGAITVNPAALANGFVGTAYDQTLTATGGAAPYSFAVSAGAMPNGLSLSTGGALTGTPTTQGSFIFTIQTTDANGCTGTGSYTVIISGAGLQFYPLAHPVRLLDTRAGASGCYTPGVVIAGGASRTQAARGTCDGLTIPANAAAITGNITTVQSGGGYLTLYPSDAAQPLVANSNYNPNEILNNVFTVGLGAADGAFGIFVTSNTDVVVDVTGYYAPPGEGGLYFHPLPKPIRLLETRVGATGCTTPNAPLAGNAETTQGAHLTCDGVTIPSTAKAIVGNATTVNPAGPGFPYLTLFPADAPRPVVASSNYLPGQVMNAPFTVGLSAAGEFKIYPTTQTELVVDVLGYYSGDAVDGTGAGLLFTPLAHPVRLLDTRNGAMGCYAPNAPLGAGSTRTQAARGTCDGVTIAANALGVVGNATVVNTAGGYLTFWPSSAAQPLVATSNFTAGQVFNRHFTVGLGAGDGAFNLFTQFTTDLVIDVAGYFAP